MAVVSGGTTLIDNGALDAAVPTGSLILLSTQTASASASISFTSDIDSTYDSYVFKFINIHPATDDVAFQFLGSINGGSSYGITKTTTAFRAFHNESDTSTSLEYASSFDLAQSTSAKSLDAGGVGNDNDQNECGFLQLFNPSSDTFVKHFISRISTTQASDFEIDVFTAGYFNTTSAIDAIKFQMSSGNIDDGIIKMYGVA